MALKLSTPINEIDAYIASEIERVHMLTIRAFMFLGEKCLIEARDRTQEASWFDQTGNLRSSIGYVVVYDGQIVNTTGFNQVKKGSDGKREGRELAEYLAKKQRKGYALIVVAGMNYAAYVEAMENKVVLASSELLAERELPNMLRQLRKQVNS